jgi:hypothetical protein
LGQSPIAAAFTVGIIGIEWDESACALPNDYLSRGETT